MFSLSQLSADSSKRESYSYTVTGTKKDINGNLQALQTMRDDGKETIFTVKRYQELLKEGKVVQTTDTTFDLKVDADYDPRSGFTAL
jgi:hypothetical protein